MDIESINKQIRAEKNRHQQKINNLKTEITKENEHSRRTIEYLQSQKQQATSQIKHECLENQYKSSENIFKSVKEELSKFM